MSILIKTVSRRALVRALTMLPALPLLRRFPNPDADEIVEVDGWILKRSDLA